MRDILPMLQPASTKPLVLRQIPIWENGVATGFVDLALERAFVYRTQAHVGDRGDARRACKQRETEARFHMLEQLADYDDELMEQLLSDMQPPRDKIFADLAKELRGRPDLPGAARLGRERQRHPPAAEGAAPRGAVRRPTRRAA